MILSLDTSCDETAVAVTEGRRVISNVIYSQVILHQKWGGVVPSIAKRAHQEKIDWAINKLKFKNKKLKIEKVEYIAVTQGPGLAIALEVGIAKGKELALKYNKKIIAVNHLEGHIYSPFVQNSKGNPKRDFNFPYLALVVSGGHTMLAIFKDHLTYEVIGETIDDAAGEALDKAGKLLGLGYPAGAVIERLAQQVDNQDFFCFPRPMVKSNDLNFSFSGLKTAFYYFLKKEYYNIFFNTKGQRDDFKKNELLIQKLASSFQSAVFDTLLIKTEKAIVKTGIKNLLVVGGVSANLFLRKKIRQMIKKYQGSVLFPPFKYLCGDNAVMIGVVAYYKSLKGLLVENLNQLDRLPRMSL